MTPTAAPVREGEPALPWPDGPWVAGPYGAVWRGIQRDLAGRWDEIAPGSGEIILDPPERFKAMLPALVGLPALATFVRTHARKGDPEAIRLWSEIAPGVTP